MKNKYVFVTVLLAVILAAGILFTYGFAHVSGVNSAAETREKNRKLKVVTSFYPMYVAAENVVKGVDNVELQNMTDNQVGCLHDYQLTTENMKTLSSADLFIVNGGGIENFLSRVASQYPSLTMVKATKGIHLQDDNAHVWMDMSDYQKEVTNIADGLIKKDPAHAGIYRKNAEAYNKKVQKLIDETAGLRRQLKGKEVILFHEAYGYLASDFGLQTAALMDLDEERQVSADEVSHILSLIKKYHVSVVLAERQYGKDMGDTIERESDAKVCYLNTMLRGNGDADSYLTGMQKNIQDLKEAYHLNQ